MLDTMVSTALPRSAREWNEPMIRAFRGAGYLERKPWQRPVEWCPLGALPDDELQACLSAYPYHWQVFLFPAWEAIYANDAERDQTFAEAARVSRWASDWYERCGYQVTEVPKVGVAERCAYVLHALGAA
jgi:hypothetical protein